MPTSDHRQPLFDAAFAAEAARAASLDAVLRRVRLRRRVRKTARGLGVAAALALLASPFLPSRRETAPDSIASAPPARQTGTPAEKEKPLIVRSRPPKPGTLVRSRSREDLFVKTADRPAPRVARVTTGSGTPVPRLDQLAFNQLLAEQGVACIAIGDEPFHILPMKPEDR